MFLTDPALRRIAAATNEVLPDQMWRHDTAADGALGNLAQILHKTSLAYNATVMELDRAADRLTGSREARMAQYANLVPSMLATVVRQSVLSDVLLDAYHGWRATRPIATTDEQYLLLQPHEPARGVVVLRPLGEQTWLVFPDTEAAQAFDIPYACRTVGQIQLTDDGWKPTAYTDPAHLETLPARTYPLPAIDDLHRGCRALLRWWHLRHSAAWHNRRPSQLTDHELTQLAS